VTLPVPGIGGKTRFEKRDAFCEGRLFPSGERENSVSRQDQLVTRSIERARKVWGSPSATTFLAAAKVARK